MSHRRSNKGGGTSAIRLLLAFAGFLAILLFKVFATLISTAGRGLKNGTVWFKNMTLRFLKRLRAR